MSKPASSYSGAFERARGIRTAQSTAQLDSRARDLLISPRIRYSTARMLAVLSYRESAELSARIARGALRVLDLTETCTDAEVTRAVDTYGDAWDLLTDLETIRTVHCALLVTEGTRTS